jgi:purine nucleoside phosphorylase
VSSTSDAAEIGVFGGSGFYSLLDDVREIKVDTPYGPPSDSFFLADVAGRKVAFLPRHGRRHTIPPHAINYRANVWAMRSLGVKAVISPCAAGSLQLAVKPGDFVVCDQFPEAWLCRELGMAVVNISLITDYDAGVHEGTEAVDATSVLEVFRQNAERIQGVVLDLIGRFPADLDGLGARAALEPTRGDGHAIAPEDVRLFETGL